MTPLQFETAYGALWADLEAELALAQRQRQFDGARLATLYRRVCENLALAQSRAYPVHLTQRLESLAQQAHRLIYRQQDYGVARLQQLFLVDFPQAVRAHRAYVAWAVLLFTLPLFATVWATYRDPSFILHFINAAGAQEFDSMYRGNGETVGRVRDAGSDWAMFGYYVKHNTGIGFRCFAAGLFGGVGSSAVLLFNGLHLGAVAGYVIALGHIQNFTSFVITHGAFELTAIVLSGAAGLRLGHTWLAPGRHSRLEALRLGAGEAMRVMYGAFAFFLIAAALEAFWSSAAWVVPAVKYAVGTACWAAVLAYLLWQGRPLAVSTRGTHAG